MQSKRTADLGTPAPTGSHKAVFRRRLKALGFATYSEYTQSHRWQKSKAAYYAHPDTPSACLCGETNDLQLHPLTYERLGCERIEDLHPLCGPCHRDIHVLEKRGLMDLRLEGYASDLRRSRYARERAERLERQGAPDAWHHEDPHNRVNWDQNARERHDQAKDRRALARKLAMQMRAS